MNAKIKVPKGWRKMRGNEKPDAQFGDKFYDVLTKRFLFTFQYGITTVRDSVDKKHVLFYIRRKLNPPKSK